MPARNCTPPRSVTVRKSAIQEKGFTSITDAAHEQVQNMLAKGTTRVVDDSIAENIAALLHEVNSTISQHKS
jgi:trimethylamine:corrinoid methyltransferase-like protein